MTAFIKDALRIIFPGRMPLPAETPPDEVAKVDRVVVWKRNGTTDMFKELEYVDASGVPTREYVEIAYTTCTIPVGVMATLLQVADLQSKNGNSKIPLFHKELSATDMMMALNIYGADTNPLAHLVMGSQIAFFTGKDAVRWSMPIYLESARVRLYDQTQLDNGVNELDMAGRVEAEFSYKFNNGQAKRMRLTWRITGRFGKNDYNVSSSQTAFITYL